MAQVLQLLLRGLMELAAAAPSDACAVLHLQHAPGRRTRFPQHKRCALACNATVCSSEAREAHLRNASRNSARESLPSPSRSILTKCSMWCWIVELCAKIHMTCGNKPCNRGVVQVDVEKLHHVADLDWLRIGCSSDGCALVITPIALLVLLDCEQPVHVMTNCRNGICAGLAVSAHAKRITAT